MMASKTDSFGIVVSQNQMLVLTSQSFSLLLFILLLYTGIPARADGNKPDILLTICGHNQSRNTQSFYTNIAAAIQLVAANITSSGFGVGSSGVVSDTVYGLGQCLNYLSSIDCQLCYGECVAELPFCLPSTDSRIYVDGCFLRYADHNFSEEAVDNLDASACSNSTVTTSVATKFNKTVIALVTNLTVGAGGDSGYYKAGSVVASPGLTVYGVAQCWRSLNVSGCRDCLTSARGRAVGCLPASDGKALNAGCFVRYSLSPFYLDSSSASGGSSASRRRLAAVLGSVFGALIMLAVLLAIFMMRRRVTNVSTTVQEGSEEVLRSIRASSLTFKYEDLRSATDSFSEINKLGQGGYGSVYKGVLTDGRVIAVKRLFFNTRQRADQFFNEVTLVSQIQHKNLVKLLGCSIEGPENLLVYEYLCNTSLDNFLFDSFKKNSLDWQRRLGIIVGTAEGLAYLHNSSEVRIIHRDIKASNILLDEKFKPKIADFGLARHFGEDKSHLSTGLAGTFGYMAPEYIVHGQLSEKSDIYSYGIVVIEIITGRKNRNLISTSTESHSLMSEGHSLMSTIWRHFNSKTMIELLDPHLQGQCSEEEALKVFHVGLLCTQAYPNLRPPMWKVVEMLTGSSTDLPLPTQPPFTNIKSPYSTTEGSRSSENLNSTSTLHGR